MLNQFVLPTLGMRDRWNARPGSWLGKIIDASEVPGKKRGHPWSSKSPTRDLVLVITQISQVQRVQNEGADDVNHTCNAQLLSLNSTPSQTHTFIDPQISSAIMSRTPESSRKDSQMERKNIIKTTKR